MPALSREPLARGVDWSAFVLWVTLPLKLGAARFLSSSVTGMAGTVCSPVTSTNCLRALFPRPQFASQRQGIGHEETAGGHSSLVSALGTLAS